MFYHLNQTDINIVQSTLVSDKNRSLIFFIIIFFFYSVVAINHNIIVNLAENYQYVSI